MSGAKTIKAFVERQPRTGQSKMDIWRKAQAAFPHKSVSWTYVLRIIRESKDKS